MDPYTPLKRQESMDVAHSPAYREVLIASGVSLLNDSEFKKGIQGAQVQDRSPSVVGLGYQK